MTAGPGVTASTDNAALGDTFGTATPNISGTRNRMNTFTLDGQTFRTDEPAVYTLSSFVIDDADFIPDCCQPPCLSVAMYCGSRRIAAMTSAQVSSAGAIGEPTPSATASA